MAIAPSNPQRIYAMFETGDGIPWDGEPTESGQLWRSEDGGHHWDLITRNRNAMGRAHYYSRVAVSPDDEDEAYFLTASFARSTDGGHTLEAVPRMRAPGGDHHDMWIDPTNANRMIVAHDQGLLYLGTENAIYVSFDDGENWQPLQTNLPHAPVSGIVIQEHFNDLVISTYGRGFWILDDLTPLQQLTSDVMDSEAHLFEPRAAYRFRSITPPSVPYDDPTVGEDPEYGASINYWLKNPAESAPTITIQNGAGELVRSLDGTNDAGLNRVHWDLLDEPSTQVRLLTPPMYADHMEVGSEGRDAPGTSPMTVLQAPGIYSVTLAVNGTEQTRSFEVQKDPNSAGGEAEVTAPDSLVQTKAEPVWHRANKMARSRTRATWMSAAFSALPSSCARASTKLRSTCASRARQT